MARVSFVSCVLFSAILQAQKSVHLGGTSKLPTTAVIDNSEIRKLISEEEKRRYEVDRFFRESHTPEERRHYVDALIHHPDQMLPGHKDFLDAMAKAPTVTVPGKTLVKVLEVSKARCPPDAITTITFVRLVITGKKPPGGTEVWICGDPSAYLAP